MSKGKQEAKSPAPDSPEPRPKVAILIAATSAAGVIGAAAITGAVTLLDEDQPSADKAVEPQNSFVPPQNKVEPPVKALDIQLESLGFKAVKPPPKVRYSFEGTTTTELDDEDAVFVLRRLDTDRWAISPPATFRPDGRWHVGWTLAKPPGDATFNAVVAKRVRISFQAAPGLDPGGGGGGFVYWKHRMAELEKLGVNAPGIGASDALAEHSKGQ